MDWPRETELKEVGAGVTGVEVDAVALVKAYVTDRKTLGEYFEGEDVACFRQSAAHRFWVKQKGKLVKQKDRSGPVSRGLPRVIRGDRAGVINRAQSLEAGRPVSAGALGSPLLRPPSPCRSSATNGFLRL